MSQSFWNTEEYKTFKKFYDWLSANWDSWNQKDRHKYKEKYESGVRKMKALALSFGLDFSEPDAKFMDANNIKWVDFGVEGVEKIGLWTGKNMKTDDGFSVFNIFWFQMLMRYNPKNRVKFIIKLMIDYNGEPYDESNYYEN